VTYSRRVKRLRAGWDGICRIEGEPDERSCRVADISMLGLGITLSHPSPAELAGRRISIDVPAVAQLEGQITHAEPILGGAIRAGIRFYDPSTAGQNVPTSQSSVGEVEA
jgi:PilZ domain